MGKYIFIANQILLISFGILSGVMVQTFTGWMQLLSVIVCITATFFLIQPNKELSGFLEQQYKQKMNAAAAQAFRSKRNKK